MHLHGAYQSEWYVYTKHMENIPPNWDPLAALWLYCLTYITIFRIYVNHLLIYLTVAIEFPSRKVNDNVESVSISIC